MDEIDKTKHYVCYFCEEEIQFAPPRSGVTKKSAWRHASDGSVRCHSNATPSNVEVPKGEIC